MGREIKFRVWDKVEKRYRRIVRLNYDDGELVSITVYGPDDFAPTILPLERVILEQSTGLKDKNGKEIYEGDIVKVVGVGVSRVIQSGWGEWQLCDLTNSDGNILSLGYCLGREYCEAIGNIHENPELLEIKND